MLPKISAIYRKRHRKGGLSSVGRYVDTGTLREVTFYGMTLHIPNEKRRDWYRFFKKKVPFTS